MTEVELWTDGACSGNPGPGGWACVLRAGSHERELFGSDPATTNNRMELLAVIEGLAALNRSCRVTVHIDSTYVMHAVTKNWIPAWQKRGWKTAAKSPVANRDLWERLISELARHDVAWRKVKGHAGVELNERVDRLAVAACRGELVA
jgi:ribonuclease HI